MKLLTIMGDTYSGKTTHGKRLAEDHLPGAIYISSGDIARSLMDGATSKEFADGKLSPHGDAIAAEIKQRIVHAFNTGMEAVILDGFPRTAGDRDLLQEWCKHLSVRPHALMLNVPYDVLKKRVALRQRDEFDSSGIMAKRHDLFMKETLPVYETMNAQWAVRRVSLGKEEPFDTVHVAIECVYRWMLNGEFQEA